MTKTITVFPAWTKVSILSHESENQQTIDYIDCYTQWSTPLPNYEKDAIRDKGYRVNRYCHRTRDRLECIMRSVLPTPEYCNLAYKLRDLK